MYPIIVVHVEQVLHGRRGRLVNGLKVIQYEVRVAIDDGDADLCVAMVLHNKISVV